MKNFLLIVGVLALIAVGAFFWLTNDDAASAARPEATLHTVARYADSVGIDTTRYAVTEADDDAAVRDKLTRLLMEVRYGMPPSNVKYAGLKESVDTSWIANVVNGTSSAAEWERGSAFTPYRALVQQYNARKRAGLPADSLLAVRKTLNFYRYLNRFDMDRFVIVNIPAAELNVYDRTGRRLLPMEVIAGKKDRRTPVLVDYIDNIVMYPHWNVPESIATKEILPKVQRDPDYLDRENMEVVNKSGKVVDADAIDWASMTAGNFPYRFRQASGSDNSLGLVKFNLSNPYSIYLHDTNARDLFDLTSDRWRSHGCVRLQKPFHLANMLMDEAVFTPGKVQRDTAQTEPKPRTHKLPQKTPVFIMYNLADVDSAGRLRFYRDVYAAVK